MSNFFKLPDGTDVGATGTEYEIPGGNLEPIPDGSNVMALIDEAKWDKTQDGMNSFISLRWSVLQPDQYKNRKVFQKLWVSDHDPNAKSPDAAAKKQEKALRMLAAIDANAGGALVASGVTPTDDALQMHLMNKPMVIKNTMNSTGCWRLNIRISLFK